MKDYNNIRETLFFAYSFEEDFYTLKLLFTCYDDSKVSVTITQIIQFYI